MKLSISLMIVSGIVLIGSLGFLIYKTIGIRSVSATIKIGFMGPLSGDASSYGFSEIKGIELAKKELAGDSVEIITEDTKCDKLEAIKGIERLLKKGVVAIIGETCSGPTLEVIPIAEKNRITLISASATSPELSGKSQYFFRTIPSDALQGVFAADFIASQRFETIAIFHTNEEYGVALNTVLSQALIARDLTVVHQEPFSHDTVDFSSAIETVVSLNPDVVFIISNSPSPIATIIKDLRSGAFKGAIMGSEGAVGKIILNETGIASEGFLVTAVSSGTKEFREKHKLEYGVDPGPYAAQAYDAFKAIYLSLKTNQQKGTIVNHLKNISFEGSSGLIAFDTNNDVQGNYEVLVVQNGTFTPLEQH